MPFEKETINLILYKEKHFLVLKSSLELCGYQVREVCFSKHLTFLFYSRIFSLLN